MAVPRAARKQYWNVVCVICDGAMSAGMAYEAMNNAGTLGSRLIVEDRRWTPGRARLASRSGIGTLLATINRPNGSSQVTYNGWPLYRYAKDVKPEKVTGQGVKDFGGKWYLVSPLGQEIDREAPSSDTGA